MDDWDQLTNLGDCGALLEQHPVTLLPERIIRARIQAATDYFFDLIGAPRPDPNLYLPRP